MSKKKPAETGLARPRWPWIGVLLVVGVVGVVLWGSMGRPTVIEHRAEGAAYVRDSACVSCHRQEFAAWSESHHALAMQPASAKTVLGDFSGVTFHGRSGASRFFKRDEDFFVNTAGTDGKRADFKIKYTFGVSPLQQYLVEFPAGRLQCLTVAWDSRPREDGGQHWYDLYPHDSFKPDDPLHWTGRYQNWNLMCGRCHTTDFHKNYDASTDTYDTKFSEINVGCQACHGPGERHLAWAAGSPSAPTADKGLLVDYRSHDHAYEVDNCAACHARRVDLADPAVAGRGLLDNYQPQLLREGYYHPDGQQRDEVYAYGSFRQSRMYQAGVRCTDCHDPHRASLKATGNALCMQCHQSHPNPRFPSLAARDYDTPQHHHHTPGSTGARCTACHMPSTPYMGIHLRPDHSIRVPRPDLSVELGVPNACNQCHTDRTAAWSLQAMDRWYGPAFRQRPTFARAFADAWAGQQKAVDALVEIADSAMPAIVRASALDLLARDPTRGVATCIAHLQDADAVVRTAAVSGLEQTDAAARVTLLMPLLVDPSRSVRGEAARLLAAVPPAQLDEAQKKSLATAIEEYRKMQGALADMPGSHLNLAVLASRQNQLDVAEREYLLALKLDPYFLPARFNLANLYNETGRNADAEKVLREGLTRVPGNGDLHYSLGLLLAEENHLEEAARELGRAAELLPRRGRVQYNYGLLLQKLGRPGDAVQALRAACREDADDGDAWVALTLAAIEQGEGATAREGVDALTRLRRPEAAELRAQLARRKP